MQALNSFETACWLQARRRHAEAAAALADVLAQSPDFAPAHANFALCQSALKQNILARHHAEKAIELEPKPSGISLHSVAGADRPFRLGAWGCQHA